MIASVVGGSLLTIGSSSWPCAWMGLEMNLLGFLPLALWALHQKKAAMYYFVVQSVGSLLILYGGLSVGVAAALCAGGAVMKLGLAPVHFWVPPVAGKLSKQGFTLLLTWQKIAPLYLLIAATLNLGPIVAANVVVGGLVVLSTNSLASTLVFSGLVQLGWVISLGGSSLMWHYLALYYISLAATVWYSRRYSTSFSVALLSYGGLPPLTGFMAKLRALGVLPTPTSCMLLAGSGVALCAYSRLLMAARAVWERPRLPLLVAVGLGSV